MPSKNKTITSILITGSAGFMGGLITRSLQGKYNIVGTSRKKVNDVSIIQCDLTKDIDVLKLAKLISPDVIIHDAITKVSADGEILFQKSVSKILLENNQKMVFVDNGNRKFEADPIHLNDIQPVLTDGPHWKRGGVDYEEDTFRVTPSLFPKEIQTQSYIDLRN